MCKEYSQYCSHSGMKHQRVIAKWTQANEEVKRQNRSILMCQQISQAEGRPCRAELHKNLRAYRSLPHNTTGKSPAELMFMFEMLGKIPDLTINLNL